VLLYVKTALLIVKNQTFFITQTPFVKHKNMKKYLLVCWYLLSYTLQAQYTWEQLKQQAVEAYKAGNYKDAAQTYEQALKKAEVDFGKLDERYTQTNYALAFLYSVRLQEFTNSTNKCNF
jgi:hypothetical protein